MKKLIRSKTFWVNLIAGCVLTYNAFSGESLDPGPIVIAALPWINILLRTVTKEPIVWNGEE